MIKPIKPSEVVSAKGATIPDFVIEAFNAEIAEQWSGSSAVVRQDAVVRRVKAANDAVEFDYKWLNVEPLYRVEGWSVVYDKPGYCETYPATFTFQRAA